MAAIFLLVSACRGADAPAPTGPPLVAQVSGTLEVAGLSAPVRVARDRWGVPHIYAQSEADLFFAQGFVQAQDRLFQMDLWRRSAQGRLSEVLGPNFIERDAMTRRVQFRGSLDEEWASYGPAAPAIASAFVRGINAWVTLARERPPEEFVLAGWTPDLWSPDDLLNRTDAFLASADAIDEVRRAGLSEVVADALRRVGTPPFFSGLAAAVRTDPPVRPEDGPAVQTGSQTLVRSRGRVTASRGALSFSEARARFDHPSARYVHLNAPGWNVIGVTAPWLPGVALGHNDRLAWGMTSTNADTQDIAVEDAKGGKGGKGGIGGNGGIDGTARRIIKDSIVVKGRKTPFEFEIERTPHGVVVASDREHDRVFVLRWSGLEPGSAGELGALSIDRARDLQELSVALARWRMPARRFVYADSNGTTGFQDVGLVPIRRGTAWIGWKPFDDLPHSVHAGGAPTVATDSRPAAGDTPEAPPVVFAHVLGITADARHRFNVGPIDRPRGDDDSAVRARFDLNVWDASRALIAPGQSGSPAAAHFMDGASLWTTGGTFPLAFSDAAVRANVESTLMLVGPRR